MFGLKQLLLVALGGGGGSVLRYVVQKLSYTWFGGPFPLGTFAVNIIGSFIIGLLYGFITPGTPASSEWRLLLITGFCGGFTTFSAFSMEGMVLLQQQRFIIFFLYFAASICLGLAATFAGAYISR